jgi:DNA-binding SARP family transcriptional activator
VEVHLLGPVGVWVADRALDVGPPKERAVLAALAVDAGLPVDVDTLVPTCAASPVGTRSWPGWIRWPP